MRAHAYLTMHVKRRMPEKGKHPCSLKRKAVFPSARTNWQEGGPLSNVQHMVLVIDGNSEPDALA